ncbi:unnamed protein product [Lepeophtheirus salmonis]|uniref:(salmon louse) hypothetical protein n=1 Tax=Lepeophtheirus salmonis TaxID=72036 RepID=A0A817FEE5_LEPSM|nr:unnamed protein product [Lepeophtheirus salmonis]CAG9477274.1 unnamed protein product [Lepeophtheirus salmonis]
MLEVCNEEGKSFGVRTLQTKRKINKATREKASSIVLSSAVYKYTAPDRHSDGGSQSYVLGEGHQGETLTSEVHRTLQTNSVLYVDRRERKEEVGKPLGG